MTGAVRSTSTSAVFVASRLPPRSTEPNRIVVVPSPDTGKAAVYSSTGPSSIWYQVEPTPESASVATSETGTVSADHPAGRLATVLGAQKSVLIESLAHSTFPAGSSYAAHNVVSCEAQGTSFVTEGS